MDSATQDTPNNVPRSFKQHLVHPGATPYLIVLLLLCVIISSMLTDAFFTRKNISDLLIWQITPLGMMSMGMLMVVLSGGIDLSVGSVLAMSSVLAAYFTAKMPLSIALILSLSCGLGSGAIAGYLIAVQRMRPFVATLALMTMTRGLAYIVSKGSPILLAGEHSDALKEFARGHFLYLPKPTVVMLSVFFAGWFVLKYMVFGRLIVAIGRNEDSIRISGVRVWTYKFSVYCIAGGLAAATGILITAQTGVGTPLFGIGAELDVMTAVVLGGASLHGGKGSVLNTFFGVCILGMLENMMNLMNVLGYPQQIIKGVIIIAAVLIQGVRRRSR